MRRCVRPDADAETLSAVSAAVAAVDGVEPEVPTLAGLRAWSCRGGASGDEHRLVGNRLDLAGHGQDADTQERGVPGSDGRGQRRGRRPTAGDRQRFVVACGSAGRPSSHGRASRGHPESMASERVRRPVARPRQPRPTRRRPEPDAHIGTSLPGHRSAVTPTRGTVVARARVRSLSSGVHGSQHGGSASADSLPSMRADAFAMDDPGP